jgi:addiction module HigA family antidote
MKIKRFTRRPTTPGEILKEEYLIPLGLTQKIVADHLGIDIKVINRLVNGKTSVSSELALKLASAFDTSPEFWLNAQLAVDLFDAQDELKDSDLPGKLNKAG